MHAFEEMDKIPDGGGWNWKWKTKSVDNVVFVIVCECEYERVSVCFGAVRLLLFEMWKRPAARN